MARSSPSSSFQSFTVIPAAGQSRRMGRAKLLLPWEGATVIEAVMRAWQEGGVDHVVAVVRAADEALAEVCLAAGALLARPERDPPEMKDSVCCGLAYVRDHFAPRAADAWLLAPADMPRLSARAVRRLLDQHRPSAPAILVSTRGGRRGHPVLFPWPLAREVAALGENEGVNALLQRHAVREVAGGEESILEDLDTPGDYRRLTDP